MSKVAQTVIWTEENVYSSNPSFLQKREINNQEDIYHDLSSLKIFSVIIFGGFFFFSL